MRILAIINPLSSSLFTNDGYSQYDGAEILWRIRNVVPTNTYKGTAQTGSCAEYLWGVH